MTKNDEKYAKMGVPKITRTLMRSNSPIIGVATTWILMLGFVLIAWTFFGVSPELGTGLKAGLTAGNFVGGLFLGFGAVTLIGCEIRSYMRIGMGYLNTLVGFVGFAFGYLPYTLFSGAHKDFLDATVIFGTHKDGSPGLISTKREIYSLITDDPTMQKVIMFVWMIILILFVRYLIKKGAKNRQINSTLSSFDIATYMKNKEIAKLLNPENKLKVKKDLFNNFFSRKKLNFAVKQIPNEFNNIRSNIY